MPTTIATLGELERFMERHALRARIFFNDTAGWVVQLQQEPGAAIAAGSGLHLAEAVGAAVSRFSVQQAMHPRSLAS